MSISRKDAIAKLWEIGNLQWKLDSTQKILYSSFQEAVNKTIVWACSRRLGKSYTLCVLAIETCLKTPNVIIKYVAPKQKMVRTIIRPIMRDLLSECPMKLRPKFYTQDNLWRFPNGSEIQIAGADNDNAKSLRGGNAHLCIVDEAGFVDDLTNLAEDVLMSTMLTTGGKLILASTPPASPDHAFITYMNKAKAENSLIIKTIEDNPRLTKEQIEDYIRELGGRQSNTVKREYYCEIIKDETRAIVPEWNAELEQALVQEWKRPPFYDCYVSMDIGYKDLTVALLAYYDFRNGKIVVEDEVVMNGRGMTTDKLAQGLKDAERANWYDLITGEIRKPYLRVADNNLIVLNDLYSLHNILFVPTMKDDSDAALNHMRMKLAAKNIIIHPRCKTLIRHLANGTWNKARTGFDRTDVDQSHYDAIDALKYLVRNINYTKNPYPDNYDDPKGEVYENHWRDEANLSPFAKHLKSLYVVPTSLKRNNK